MWVRHQEYQKQVSESGTTHRTLVSRNKVEVRGQFAACITFYVSSWLHTHQQRMNPHGSVFPPSHLMLTGSWMLLDSVYI